MFNFFKKQPIIEFLTEDYATRKYVPVVPASELKPKEYLDMPATVPNFGGTGDKPTVRMCPAITGFLDSGYIIRAWCDMRFEFYEDRGTKMCKVTQSKNTGIEQHDKFQIGKINDKKYIRQVVKLMSPWWIKTAPGYSFYFMPLAFWQLPYQPVAGIIDGDLNHMHCPINLWVNGDASFEIKLGDPLVQVLPFKRETNVTAVVRAVYPTDQERETKLVSHLGIKWKGIAKYFSAKKSYRVELKDQDL